MKEQAKNEENTRIATQLNWNETKQNLTEQINTLQVDFFILFIFLKKKKKLNFLFYILPISIAFIKIRKKKTFKL